MNEVCDITHPSWCDPHSCRFAEDGWHESRSMNFGRDVGLGTTVHISQGRPVQGYPFTSVPTVELAVHMMRFDPTDTDETDLIFPLSPEHALTLGRQLTQAGRDATRG